MGRNVRKPPLLPRRDGRCRWCAGSIPPRLKKDGTPAKRQTTFHKDCSREYWKAQNPQRFARQLRERDGYRCGICKTDRLVEEVDHIVPLWMVAHMRAFQRRRRYFTIWNLQLLCIDCHKAKSKREAWARARWNKLRERRKKCQYEPT